jgi:hypothetical protein
MKVVSGQRGCALQGGFLLLLVLLLVMGVTGWFVGRSDGFRQMVAERLSDRMGLEVKIGNSYIGWPYVLVLRDVEGSHPEAGGLRIREIRIGRRLTRWSMRLRGGEISFRAEAPGHGSATWPTVLSRLSALRDAGALDIMRASADLQSVWTLQWEDLDFIWLGPDAVPEGSIRGSQFRMNPVRIPSGRLMYYRLSFSSPADQAMGSVRDLEWEWLSRGGHDYIELVRTEAAPAVMLKGEP